ncbi:uncharacterized protein LOC120163652 [Hibiscus syriacus]|uniref:uncharacterized protein LOC120163652 n=1 Tax=Hibiscus syriacus TaxID=106335 RepID=UPI001922311D|nr:uncharacterized protein LOC120163652 [Hibiscus syriacus]
MKRRSHEINPEDPSPIRISSPAAQPKVRIPVNLPDSRSNRADGPKTSEFAFFKKLKKDAGKRFDSHSMQRVKNPTHKLNSSECCRGVGRFKTEATRIVRNISKSSEGTNIARNCSKDFRSPLPAAKASSELGSLLSIEKVNSKDSRSLLPINNVTDISLDPLPSLVDRAVSNSDVNLKNDFTAVEPIFSLEDWLEQHSDNKKPGGSYSDQTELFSKKRRKLFQWACNSFPEIEKLHTKGYDVISTLLSRLFPRSNEKDGYRSAESAQLESNTKSELLACPRSSVPSTKLDRLPTRKNLEVQDTLSYLGNGTSSYWPDILRETNISNIDSTIYNNHSALQKKLELPTCKLREKNLTSFIDSDSTLGFPFVRHGSFLPFISSKEPDNLLDPNGSLPARENLLPLLEWDSLYGTSSYWSDSSTETMHSIYSPPYNNDCTLQNNLESPSFELREKNLNNFIEGDSSFGFPFVRHGSFVPFSSFKESDDLHDPIGSFPGREPRFPLLEWDSINMNKRSSSATFHNTKWTVVPALQCPWDHQQSLNIPFSSFKNLDDSQDPVESSPGRETQLPLLEWHSIDVNESSLSSTCPNTNWTLIPAVQSSLNHWQSPNNWCESFGALGLCSAPVIRNYPRDFHALVSPTSASYDKYEFGRSILNTEEEIADLHHLPLTLSHSSKCLNLIADCNHYEIACQGSETSDILPSLENHLGFMNNALVEENKTPDYRSLINCNEDMLDIHDQVQRSGNTAMVKTCSNRMAVFICRRKCRSQITIRVNSEYGSIIVAVSSVDCSEACSGEL